MKPLNTITTEHLEVQALYQIAQLIGSALDLDKALAEILRVLHETLRMERATLVLPNMTGTSLAIRTSYGLTSKEAQKGVYGLDEGVIGKIFSSCQPFVVPDIHKDPLFLNRTGARKNLSKQEISFIGVPVTLMEKPVGVLTADRLFGPEISFEEDIRFLTVVAVLIAQFLNLHQAIVKKEKHLIEENISLKQELRNKYSHRNIIGQCKAMQEVFRDIEKVAPSRATTLILGDSGTGKELVARAIHVASPRQDKPFIKVNCAAIPETLLESELLGHEKGAFTGAHATKKGRFELASSGTLFLDEIGELPLHLQAKLLRVLQEQSFERLGGTHTINVDVRIIAATNRSLVKAVEEKSFREDLFYRLNVVPINLPSLRNRIEDVPLLLDHFLRESVKTHGKKTTFSREAIHFLLQYHWPGNVRELQNLVERLVIMAEGTVISLEEMPSYMAASREKDPLPPPEPKPQSMAAIHTIAPRRNRSGKPLEEIERREIEAALLRHGWVRARAARELGLTQRQIGYKIKKYSIRPPEYLQ